MTYAQFLPVVAVCALLLIVPGLVIALALRLRGLWLAVATPALSITAIAAAALVAPMVGLAWSVLVVLAVAAAATVVLWLLTRFVPVLRGRAASRPVSPAWPIFVAVGAAALLIGLQLVRVISAPDDISQSYDNVFHLNAVRWALDTQSASPLMIGRMTQPTGTLPFYPSAWHGLVALIVQLTGTSIPAAVNAVTFVVACLVWPIGVLLVTRTLGGTRTSLIISAGVLAAAFPTFPLLLLNYGVLYPMFLAYAVLPVALACLIALLHPEQVRGRFLSRWAALLLLAGIVPGMAVAHPGSFVALLAFSLPIVVVAAVRAFRSGGGRRRNWIVGGALGAYALLGIVALQLLRPPAAAISWQATESLGQAFGEVLTASVYFMPPAIVAGVFALLGIVVAARRRRTSDWIMLGIWVVALILYVIVAASPSQTLRLLVTGPFYNNIPRLAALYPLATIPLAAVGASWVWRATALWWRRRRALPSQVVRRIAAAVAVVALAVTTQGWAIREAIYQASGVYAYNDDSWMLTPDEMEMFDVIRDVVPEGDLIAGNPWTGTGLVYAFTGRPALTPHLLMEQNDLIDKFMNGFAEADSADAACDAARELDVRWVLDFGPQQINNGDVEFPGLVDLTVSDNVELVEQVGDAALYRVVGCDVP